jgi:RNA recognition motif-containing protein
VKTQSQDLLVGLFAWISFRVLILFYTVAEAELLELFKQYGTVASCNLILDAATGKSKGFAFVEMPHAREAIKAIKGLNTLRLHGTGIRVKQAEDKSEKPEA